MSSNPYAALGERSQFFVGPRQEDSVMELRALDDPFRSVGTSKYNEENPYLAASSPSQKLINGTLRTGDSIYDIYNLPKQFSANNPYAPSNASDLSERSAGDDTVYERQQIPDPWSNENDYRPASAFAPEMYKFYQQNAGNTANTMRNNKTQRRLAYHYPENEQSYSFGGETVSVKSWRPSRSSSVESNDTRVVNGLYKQSNQDIFPRRQIKKGKKFVRERSLSSEGGQQHFPPSFDSEIAHLNNYPDVFDPANPYTVEERFNCQRATNRDLRTLPSECEFEQIPDFAGNNNIPRSLSSRYTNTEATYRENNQLPNVFDENRPFPQTSSQYFALPNGQLGYVVTTHPQNTQVYIGQPNNSQPQVFSNPYQSQMAQQKQRLPFSDASIAELNKLPDVFTEMCRASADVFANIFNQAANQYYQAQQQFLAPSNVPSTNPYAHGTTYRGSQKQSQTAAAQPPPKFYAQPHEQESYFKDNQVEASLWKDRMEQLLIQSI